MKLAVGILAYLLAVYLLLIVEEFLDPMAALNGARVVLIPMVFCYFALAAPTWAMLLAAAYTGFLTDLSQLHVVDGQVEIALGWSMVFFVVFGLFAHGFQPAFQRGHWWVHVALTVLGTCGFLALQYAMITFRRPGFVFNDLVAWRILAPGLMAAVLAPLVHLLVLQCGQFFPEVSREPGRFRRSS